MSIITCFKKIYYYLGIIVFNYILKHLVTSDNFSHSVSLFLFLSSTDLHNN